MLWHLVDCLSHYELKESLLWVSNSPNRLFPFR